MWLTKLSNKTLGIILFLVTFLAVFMFGAIWFRGFYHDTLVAFQKKQSRLDENTVLYDIKGKPFHLVRGLEDRKYISLKDVNRNLQLAVVGIEDARFFRHHGLDFIRIFGALYYGLRGQVLTGASTITQQLVKLTLLSPERTLSRKVKEALMAIVIEHSYTKEEILEFYLNKVYLGNRNYGVEQAALYYLNKPAKDLNLAESAFIAGLIKKPEGNNPLVSDERLKRADRRLRLILKRLLQIDWITQLEYKKATGAKVTLHSNESNLREAPYFTNHILQQLVKTYGFDEVYGGGLRVYTTLDRDYQDKMEKVVQKRAKIARSFDQLAGVSIDPRNGYVKALVGGVDFNQSEFNRVTQAKRQPGSSFKPILYSAAIESGVLPNDVFIDEPTAYSAELDYAANFEDVDEYEIEEYEPQNFSGTHLGPITMAHALRVSNNVVSVKILYKIGIPRLIRKARDFGIEIPAKKGLGLALGDTETTLLKMVSAYGVFANEGTLREPIFILKVTDAEGRVLEKRASSYAKQVLTKDQAYQMNRMLQDVVRFGTGKNAKIRRMSGGKTGTTDGFRDAWYIGYTSDLVTGFWAGNDKNTPMKGEQGGGTPASLWRSYMEQTPAVSDQEVFTVNENFEEHLICAHSGLKATEWCSVTSKYSFKKGQIPYKYCDIHVGPQSERQICSISGQLANQYCPPTAVESQQFFQGEEPTVFCTVHGRSEPLARAQKESFSSNF